MSLRNWWNQWRGRSTSTVRETVEALLDGDDADALAAFLRTRQDEGRELIRAWDREVRATEDVETRKRLARRITALVAVYAHAFGDREPLEWFRKPGNVPEVQVASGRLEEARGLLASGSASEAWVKADAGVRLLRTLPEPNEEALAVWSALSGVQGGASIREGKLDDAAAHFGESLDIARRTKRPDSLGAALINWIDVQTRRRAFEDAADAMEEALSFVRDPPLDDALGKVLIERGVALVETANLDDAIPTFDRAVALRPAWPFPLYQRAWARFLQGDSGGALDDFRAAAAIARVFFTVQREIRCLEDVAAGHLPIDAYRAFCARRGQLASDPGSVEGAMGEIVEHFPGFAAGHLLRGEARLRMGDVDGAIACIQSALVHDPDEDTASNALFLQWSIARQRKDAAQMAEVEERLETAYREHPAAMLVKRAPELPSEATIRWTYSFDGALLFDVPATREDRSDRGPESPR
jgi:tetratricopeptide (TPR) repeat protein